MPIVASAVEELTPRLGAQLRPIPIDGDAATWEGVRHLASLHKGEIMLVHPYRRLMPVAVFAGLLAATPTLAKPLCLLDGDGSQYVLTTAKVNKGKQGPVFGYAVYQGDLARFVVFGVGAMNKAGADAAIGFTEYRIALYADAAPASTDTVFHQVEIVTSAPGKLKPGDVGGDCHAFSTGSDIGACTSTTVINCADAPPFS